MYTYICVIIHIFPRQIYLIGYANAVALDQRCSSIRLGYIVSFEASLDCRVRPCL